MRSARSGTRNAVTCASPSPERSREKLKLMLCFRYHVIPSLYPVGDAEEIFGRDEPCRTRSFASF